jgi:hypothetical protein
MSPATDPTVRASGIGRQQPVTVTREPPRVRREYDGNGPKVPKPERRRERPEPYVQPDRPCEPKRLGRRRWRPLKKRRRSRARRRFIAPVYPSARG